MKIRIMFSCSVILVSLVFVSKAASISKEEIESKLNSLNSVCGRSSKTRVKRVVGGENAELGEYPWMAVIGGTRETGGPISWICAGSLISDQYVVTAAVCLSSRVPYTYTVRIGDLALDDSVVDGGLKVESTVIHEQYNRSLYTNDIGLMKLERKVEFNDLIKPICLPPPEFSKRSFEGNTVELAGWGLVEFGGRSSNHLQKVTLQISSLDDCKQVYPSKGKKPLIDGNNICTLSPGKDACKGDSGAPLMLSQDSRMFLLGTVSFGQHPCASPKKPTVNVRIPQYTSWILDHLDL